MNFFWPDIQDMNDAQKACGQGAGIAFFIAIITGVVAWLQASGKINIMPGIGMEAFIDVALFVIIGVGLMFKSRIAGVAGVLLYFTERIMMIKMYGVKGAQIIPTIIFGLAFISGMRGAFIWQALKKAEMAESGKKPMNPFLKILIALAVLGVIGGLGYYLLKKNPQVQSKMPSVSDIMRKADIKNPLPVTVPKNIAAVLPSMDAPGTRTFKLFNGKVVKGVVLQDDPIYYRVDTGGGVEEVVIKEDITEEITPVKSEK